ncbi:sulfite exporter TauE/SafE family protein, partial [bacterium]
PLMAPSILGSIAGAILLLNTSDRAFAVAVPFLIFMAAALLLLQPKIRRWIGRHEGEAVLSLRAGLVIQTLVGIYGGYFGAGIGIMMLATFSLYMEGTVHEINAVKNWLSLAINGACSVVFLFKGVALWHLSFVMALGSLVGGYYVARYSQRLDPNRLRGVIGTVGLVMSAYYFYRAFTL